MQRTDRKVLFGPFLFLAVKEYLGYNSKDLQKEGFKLTEIFGMDQKPLISIIVPIYMIDRYVGICVESILNQTYRNIEIVLVDDGSGDRSAELCDLYASKDSRIKVVHKENGGLVSARKAGLAASTGSLVTYVDGDDWVGREFIEKLYVAYEQTDADIVCAAQTRVLFDQSVQLLNAIPVGVYSVDEGNSLRGLQDKMMSYGTFYRPGITTYVWNKLFKRELLFDIQMQVDDRISIGEDAAVTYPALMKADKVVVTDNTEYHYRQREDSMLKQSVSFSREAEKLKYLYDYLMKWNAGIGNRMTGQITDYVLSICIIRSGGRLPADDFSTFDKAYFGKRVVIYSAGTFGQQLVKRFKETGHCKVVGWVDDDYWEYRRCCMDVDPVETVRDKDFDYILVASVDSEIAERVIGRLGIYGVARRRILTVSVPEQDSLRETLTKRFILGGYSHA